MQPTHYKIYTDCTHFVGCFIIWSWNRP